MSGSSDVFLSVLTVLSQDVGMVLEARGVQCAGVVVADVAERFSHYKAVESLSAWCARHGVPGITGVDTRAITTLLRDQGTTLGRLAVGADADAPAPAATAFWDPAGENLVDQVSTKAPYELNPTGDVRIAVLDFGAKANILRALVRTALLLLVLPGVIWNRDLQPLHDVVAGTAVVRA